MGIYESCNNLHKNIIIQLGEIIYKNFKLNERTDEDILELINKKNSEMGDIFDNIKSNFEKTYNEKNNEIIELQQKSHENYLNGFEEGKRVYSLLVDEKQKQIEEKDKQIEKIKPKEHLNTKEKGDEFEKIINNDI